MGECYLETLVADSLDRVSSLVNEFIRKSNDTPLSVSVSNADAGKIYVFILMQKNAI